MRSAPARKAARTVGRVGAVLVAVLGCIAGQRVLAQTDLLRACEAAERHDPMFAAARAGWEAGDTRRRQGRAMQLPQVMLTGSAGYVELDRDTTGAQFNAPGFGSSSDAEFRTKINGGNATSVALSARQPLYNAERSAIAHQLDRQAQWADAQFRDARQALILRTVEAYFDVLLAEDALAGLKARDEAAAQALEAATAAYDAGAVPVTDRYEAQARRDEIRAQELTVSSDLRVKRAMLADITGQGADRLARLAADTSVGDFDAGSLPDWSARAAARNPTITMLQLGGEIARDEIDKFKALASPSVDLVAQLADDRMQGGNGMGTTRITSNTRAIGIQLTIPLFTGGLRSAKHDEAVALAEKARYDLEAAAQAVRRQALDAWLGVTTGRSRVQAYEAAVQSAKLRLDATDTGRDVGARTTLDLMNAQADFYESRHRLVDAKYRLLLNHLRLAAVAGELSTEQVRAVNQRLTQ